jgi:AcrR family transcriptional regulator
MTVSRAWPRVRYALVGGFAGGETVEGQDLDKVKVPKAKGGRRVTRPRRTQEERSTETRRKLVEAAIRVSQESGYANLTISKVAQQAGLTNGAMQHHFSSRDELVLAVLDALYPFVDIPFENIASKKLPVRERVNTFIDHMWQIYSRPEYLVIWDIAFGTRADPPLRAKLQAYQREIAARMRKQLAAFFADVGLTSDGADQILSLTMSCLRGFALWTVFGVDHRRADLEQVKEIAYERILNYTASRKK